MLSFCVYTFSLGAPTEFKSNRSCQTAVKIRGESRPKSVFKCVKELQDRIKLVRYPPHPLCILRALMMILHLCLQVASEKAGLVAALTKYEKDINLLESLYNDNKELLDQHKLDTDLKELGEYVWFCFLLWSGLTMAQNPTRPR